MRLRDMIDWSIVRARFAPKASFDAPKALRPDIECSWFERYDI